VESLPLRLQQLYSGFKASTGRHMLCLQLLTAICPTQCITEQRAQATAKQHHRTSPFVRSRCLQSAPPCPRYVWRGRGSMLLGCPVLHTATAGTDAYLKLATAAQPRSSACLMPAAALASCNIYKHSRLPRVPASDDSITAHAQPTAPCIRPTSHLWAVSQASHRWSGA
jgi:hypothetical protein